MVKKLGLLLALLILGSFLSQGAFAANVAPNTYPACYKGYGVGDPLYNGTNGDMMDTDGWCVDGYGVLQPKYTLTKSSTQPNSYGGYAIPVLDVNNGGTTALGFPTGPATFDVLVAQQTGSHIVDYGGYSVTATVDSLLGIGQHHVLPPAMPGEEFTITSASKSVITVDVLTPVFAATEGYTYANADTIEWSPGGTAMTAGQNIRSPGFAGDSVTLYSPAAGQWIIKSMQGSVANNVTSDSLWTVSSTQ